MNRERRTKIRAVINKLEKMREAIEFIREEEDEARENMPGNLQESGKYEESEECSEAMDSAIGSIDDAISSLEETI